MKKVETLLEEVVSKIQNLGRCEVQYIDVVDATDLIPLHTVGSLFPEAVRGQTCLEYTIKVKVFPNA